MIEILHGITIVQETLKKLIHYQTPNGSLGNNWITFNGELTSRSSAVSGKDLSGLM